MSKHVIYDWYEYLISGDEPEWVEAFVEYCETNERPVPRIDTPFDVELFEQALGEVWDGWTEHEHANFDEAADDLIERVREVYELAGDVDPDAVRDFALGCSGWDLEDEIANLNAVKLSGRGILCVASLGLWDGRHTGWKIINSTCVDDCVKVASSAERLEIYTEGGQLVIREGHHDGTNHYTFYAFDCDPDELEERLYRSHGDVIELTGDETLKPIGDAVNKLYGWED